MKTTAGAGAAPLAVPVNRGSGQMADVVTFLRSTRPL